MSAPPSTPPTPPPPAPSLLGRQLARLRRRQQAYRHLWLGRLIFWGGAVAIGFLGVLFAKLVDAAVQELRQITTDYPFWPFIIAPLGGAGLVWLTRRFFPGAEGSGIPQVMAEMAQHGAGRPGERHRLPRPLLSLRIVFGKIVLGTGAMFSGFSMGREGPMVQIGAALMHAIGERLPRRLQVDRRHLLAAGGAAGIAAAFNTPLAGILFAIEELSRGLADRMSGLIITAIVIAGVVTQAYFGNYTYFGWLDITQIEAPHNPGMLLAVSLLCGVAGGLFARLLIATTDLPGRLGHWRRTYPVRFAGGCGLVLALLGTATGGITFGTGYEEAKQLLDQSAPMPWHFGLDKYIATAVSFASGIPGGIFAPSLSIGAGLGQNLQDLNQLAGGSGYPPGMTNLLCMAGFLAAVTQTPITAFVIVALAWWQPWQTAKQAPRYEFTQVERGPLSASVSSSGTLSALVTVQVGSQVSGQVQTVLADFNTPVKRDQVIARLDPATFQSRVTQAEADLAATQGAVDVARAALAVRQAEAGKARATLAEAERNLKRKQDLVAQGFLSTAEQDTAQTGLTTAREDYRLAENQIQSAQAQVGNAQAGVRQRQAQLEQARLELARTVIRAPVDGVVVSRNVDAGQTVAASLQAPVLFTIAQDLREMEVNIAVDEADVGRVQEGQKVRFTVDAFPGERFSGQVTQIRKAPVTSNNVVTFSVMARVQNPDLKLLPGMTASARILTEERKDVLQVPNEALRFRPTNPDGSPIKLEVQKRGEGPGIPGRVWVLGADGQPAPIALRLGVSDGKKTEVLQGDVKAGTALILKSLDEQKKPSGPPVGMGR